MSADEIATAFTDHYYSMRQTDQGGADQLAGLFVSRIDQCRITVHYSTSIGVHIHIRHFSYQSYYYDRLT